MRLLDVPLTKAGLPRQRLRGAPVLDRVLFRTRRDESGCWLWQGARTRKGYGHIRSDDNGPLVAVHRVAYVAFVGAIPEGLEIDHLCRVRHCVNPAHLEAVDHATNVRRGRRNQNHGKASCVRGHEFTPDNTRRDSRGRRACRACGRERQRLHRERKRSS